MLRIIYRLKKCVFIIGIVIGVILACLLIDSENETSMQMSCKIRDGSEIAYREWFSMQNFKKYPANYFELRDVNSASGDLTSEASYLYSVVHVHCVVFIKKRRNALAVKNTWAKHCNEILFFGLENRSDVSVTVLKPKSSWHYLCDAIRYLWQNHKANLHWALFVSDDVFVIPENLRYYVASLDFNEPHYLGEEGTFWGIEYNVGEAGYVLSKGVIYALQNKFSSSESCLRSGKYWRNEDFYLGKNLGEMGITPAKFLPSVSRQITSSLHKSSEDMKPSSCVTERSKSVLLTSTILHGTGDGPETLKLGETAVLYTYSENTSPAGGSSESDSY